MSTYTDQRKRYQVYLPPATYEALAAWAARVHRPIGLEMARALGWYLLLMQEFDEAMVRQEPRKEQKA